MEARAACAITRYRRQPVMPVSYGCAAGGCGWIATPTGSLAKPCTAALALPHTPAHDFLRCGKPLREIGASIWMRTDAPPLQPLSKAAQKQLGDLSDLLYNGSCTSSSCRYCRSLFCFALQKSHSCLNPFGLFLGAPCVTGRCPIIFLRK